MDEKVFYCTDLSKVLPFLRPPSFQIILILLSVLILLILYFFSLRRSINTHGRFYYSCILRCYSYCHVLA